jgi:plasmid stabilization system protein ParE
VNLRLRDAAEADIGDAHSWYRERGHDLGDQFLGALDQCLESIQRNPLAFPAVHGDIRRALLRKFPYCVFYIASESEVTGSAVFMGIATRRCGAAGATHDYGVQLSDGAPSTRTWLPFRRLRVARR